MAPKRNSKLNVPRKSRLEENSTSEYPDEYDGNWDNNKALIKPEDQVELTEQELKEEITRILNAHNPHAPDNIIRYSFKENIYKQVPHVDQLAVHFSLEGNLLHKDSEEAKRQMTQQALSELGSGFVKEMNEQKADQDDDSKIVTETPISEGTINPEPDSNLYPMTVKMKHDQKPPNQFNYSERASQTFNSPLRERDIQTEPPPRCTFNANASQWEIYDAYMIDLEKNEKAKQTGSKPSAKIVHKHKKTNVTEKEGDEISRISRAAMIIERMINQNTYEDIGDDFKYYDDPADEFKDPQGSLLPLWTFTYEEAKKLAVTSLCWNPTHSDLFAVSYGSYEFMKQNGGLILYFSLKNPSFPEYRFKTDSGVMCIDCHENYPYLVCVGFYDGHVAVYNMISDSKTALTQSTAEEKHSDPVWEVRWQKDDIDNNLNFYSVSSDGNVVSWTVVKSELKKSIKLKLCDEQSTEDHECGTAMAFHKDLDHLYIVGTEEGKLHTCSKAFSSRYLSTFSAHYMGIYKIEWNHFHPKVYMTCSADWNVKIWDHSYHKNEPMFIFDLNSAVGDIAWAPFSSTVFAAVTADGKVHVYDLNVNKYDPICSQVVARKKKTRLTHIKFNSQYKIILVGDDRGYVQTLKLSPNLRKMPKERKNPFPDPNNPIKDDKRTKEIEKMEKLLSLVKEPDRVSQN